MTAVTKNATVSRRAFVVGSAAAGGGLAIGIGVPGIENAAAQGTANATANELGVWVVVRPNDDIVVRVARSEMGQGTLTGLVQLVAEELEADWKKVKWQYVTPGQNLARKRPWGDFRTVGSWGIRMSHEYVRQGGAVAREMLKQAAANEWKVPVSEIKTEKGVLSHASGKRATYGKLATAAGKLTPPDPKSMKLKDPKTWTIAGKPLARLDTVDKLTGKQVFAADVKLPGMLNAAVRDAPVFGAKIASVDSTQAESMPGVKKVVRVGDSGVAVIADTWWHAKKALDTIKVAYQPHPAMKVSQTDIEASLTDGLTSPTGVFVGNKAGDFAKAIESAAKKVEATFSIPYVNHATMETMNATALVTADKCEVWCPTQGAEQALAAAANASGLKQEQCEVHRFHLGGGFGRRATSDFVNQAVLIAKQMPGTPIKMLWSREEDMVQGRYRPIGKAKLTAGLDAQGNLEAFHMRIAAPSIMQSYAPAGVPKDGSDPFSFQGLQPGGTEGPFGYNSIPNRQIEHAHRNHHVPVMPWRGVNNNQNAIYVECFIEEVAKAAGKDPLAFRRQLLANSPKHLGVLNAVAEKADYGKPLAAGRFRGIAQMAGYGSYCAAVAEVSVSDRGRVKIHRMVVGTNCGHVVNPDQVRAQIEGSVAYGLGAMLHMESTVKDGAIVERNFDTVPSMLIDEMPHIESVMVPTFDFWGGVGEPTIMVAAPAVLNAIFHATGKMQRTMPLKNRNLRA
jgi:isoquinoline 1-oxidoreductase beta subunit